MRTLIGLLLAFLAAVYGAEPFLVFASDAAYHDPATVPLVRKYFSTQDYLGYRAVARTSGLAAGTQPITHTD